MAATIVSQIEDVEKEIVSCEERLDSIDRSLRLGHIPNQERGNLIEEEGQIKEKIKEHENELKLLRGENRKSMLVSVAVLGLLYLMYLLMWPK